MADLFMLDKFIIELLHINEDNSNKLIDLSSKRGGNSYLLFREETENFYEYLIDIIKERIGKIGNTALRDSSIKNTEQLVGAYNNVCDWKNIFNTKDVKELDSFVENARKETSQKGNNPLFLSIGAIRWKIPSSDETLKEILSPLIIFPIKLIRTGETQPISIEFIDDDIYINTCFFHKLKSVCGEDTANNFPLPNGNTSIEDSISLEKLNLVEYFNAIQKYVDEKLVGNIADTTFIFEPNLVAFSTYNHEDICMYYDIRRNKEEICNHPIIQKIFDKVIETTQPKQEQRQPKCVLPFDYAQENIIRRVVNGENLEIKGPPGTGKTQTIANMIAALMYEGKKVLFVSKKLSALAEVYNKLPEVLRSFVLRLDYEGEKEAAKVNATSIQKELYKILNTEITQNEAKLYASSTNGQKNKNDLLKQLASYAEIMFFNNNLAGGAFYEALNIYCKNYDCKPICFASPEQIMVTYNEYLSTKKAIIYGGSYFSDMTNKNEHRAKMCAWYGIDYQDINLDVALREGKIVKTKIGNTFASFKKYLPESMFYIENLPIENLNQIVHNILSKSEIEELILSEDLVQFAEELFEVQDLYNKNAKSIANSRVLGSQLFEKEEILDIPPLSLLEKGIELSFIQRIAESTHIYGEITGLLARYVCIDEVYLTMVEFKKNVERSNKAKENADRIFTLQFFDEINTDKNLIKAYDAINEHNGKRDKTKVSFSTKSAFKKLLKYSKAPSIMCFDDICYGIIEYNKYVDSINRAGEGEELIKKLVFCPITEAEMFDIYEILQLARASNEKDAKLFIKNIISSWGYIEKLLNFAGLSYFAGINYGDLYNLYSDANIYINIKKLLKKLNENYSFITTELSPLMLKGISNSVNVIVALKETVNNNKVFAPNETVSVIIDILNNVKSVQEEINFIKQFAEVKEFLHKYIKNSFYANYDIITLKDLETFYEEIDNSTILNAVYQFESLINTKHPLSVKDFFMPFIYGNREDYLQYSMEDIFEHSFYYLMLERVKTLLGNDTTRLSGKNMEVLFEDFKKTESEIFGINANIIALKSSQKINKDDIIYRFLRSESSRYKVCRLLFKNHSEAIMKLVQCFILSPSTISLLFRNKDFSNFDVLIIDEASQMPPEQVIPAIFRAKQCVVVGDEWQMPPIKHFVKNSNVLFDEYSYEPIKSVIELMKENNSFPVENLISHYRSNTESLIAYSKRYYRDMLTFPAVVPYDENVGFRDIYVEDGYSKEGENIKEAETVIIKLKEHFKRYYDEKTYKLSQSIGVVVFGEKQLKLVKSLIAKDKTLSDCINLALSVYKEPSEKLIFFRTIETVQGQETEHLILSLTYGKLEKNRIYANFGQLNQKNLGERIFNVAVTRAKSSVTVIHSILAREIDSININYIKEYLEKVEFFSQNTTANQFYSSGVEQGFVKNVASYIEKLGIEQERIIINYGVTENSIRIPIAILSPDKKQAELGVFCETPPDKINYIDHNIRYQSILENRGWNKINIFIFDWITNESYEKEKLKKAIQKYTTQN